MYYNFYPTAMHLDYILNLLIKISLISICLCDEVKVSLENGSVLGITEQSHDGRNYFAFKGVPFAKPPVGDLRLEVSIS